MFLINQIISAVSQFSYQETEKKCDIISSVPKEIALHILSFLKLEDLSYASEVNKKWNILLQDDKIWRNKLLLFPLLKVNSYESAKLKLINWIMKCNLWNHPTVNDKDMRNAEILANHDEDCLYSILNGEIHWISKWNFPARILTYVFDPFGHRLDNAIKETFNRMIFQAEQRKELGSVWRSPKKIGGKGREILYADLMTVLLNKRLINLKHFDRAIVLRNATLDLINYSQKLVVPS